MKYPEEWKGRLKYSSGKVFWDGKFLGMVVSRSKPGARSPGGMKTDTVFVTDDGKEFPSLTKAIEYLIKGQ